MSKHGGTVLKTSLSKEDEKELQEALHGLVVVSFGLGQYWQYEIRKLMGVTDCNIALVVASPFIAALIFCLILLIGRGLYRWAAACQPMASRPAPPQVTSEYVERLERHDEPARMNPQKLADLEEDRSRGPTTDHPIRPEWTANDATVSAGRWSRRGSLSGRSGSAIAA